MALDPVRICLGRVRSAAEHLPGHHEARHVGVGGEGASVVHVAPELGRLRLDDPRTPRQPPPCGGGVAQELLVVADEGERCRRREHGIGPFAGGRVHARSNESTTPARSPSQYDAFGRSDQSLGELLDLEHRRETVRAALHFPAAIASNPAPTCASTSLAMSERIVGVVSP